MFKGFQWPFNPVRSVLVCFGGAGFGLLVLAANLKLLPFGPLECIALFLLAALFSAYRPGWSFLLLVLALPLETVNLAPAGWGIEVRPYQALSGAIGIGLLVRLATRRLPLPVPQWRTLDTLWIIVLAGAFLSSLFAPMPGTAFKQAAILMAAILLYAVTRYFVRDAGALPRLLPFLATGSALTALYALWQNARFQAGLSHFETMPGRPNGTFAEADWLGAYLAAALVIAAVLAAHVARHTAWRTRLLFCIGAWMTLLLSALILTVARSAWLGALAGLAVVFTLLSLTYRKQRTPENGRALVASASVSAASLMAGLALVSALHLTDFKLGQRAQSVAGLQTITVSCAPGTAIPERIANLDELAALGCRHIDLEGIGSEEAAGRLVATTDRPDPNVSIRKELWLKSLSLAEAHPFTGIGLGSIGRFLGSDGRGAMLNSSNFFLELWLGGGALALVGSLAAWGYVFWTAFQAHRKTSDAQLKTLALALLGSGTALLVFNLFNAGILLGFLFVWFAMSAPLWSGRTAGN